MIYSNPWSCSLGLSSHGEVGTLGSFFFFSEQTAVWVRWPTVEYRNMGTLACIWVRYIGLHSNIKTLVCLPMVGYWNTGTFAHAQISKRRYIRPRSDIKIQVHLNSEIQPLSKYEYVIWTDMPTSQVVMKGMFIQSGVSHVFSINNGTSHLFSIKNGTSHSFHLWIVLWPE